MAGHVCSIEIAIFRQRRTLHTFISSCAVIIKTLHCALAHNLLLHEEVHGMHSMLHIADRQPSNHEECGVGSFKKAR